MDPTSLFVCLVIGLDRSFEGPVSAVWKSDFFDATGFYSLIAPATDSIEKERGVREGRVLVSVSECRARY